MIEFRSEKDYLPILRMAGFFVGWPTSPEENKLREILNNSTHIWLAIAGNRLVGFANMITDNTFYGYIPLIEVLPEYQNQGIGTTLIHLMKESGRHLYAIDLICDRNLTE